MLDYRVLIFPFITYFKSFPSNDLLFAHAIHIKNLY
jgi:hypothetical protein